VLIGIWRYCMPSISKTRRAGKHPAQAVRPSLDGQLVKKIRTAWLRRHYPVTSDRADLIATLAFDGGHR
jgi:hypothetical protein